MPPDSIHFDYSVLVRLDCLHYILANLKANCDIELSLMNTGASIWFNGIQALAVY